MLPSVKREKVLKRAVIELYGTRVELGVSENFNHMGIEPEAIHRDKKGELHMILYGALQQLRAEAMGLA